MSRRHHEHHVPHLRDVGSNDPDSLLHTDWPARAERERHRGTHFTLNPGFVEDIGEAKAREFLNILNEVGAHMHQHPRAEISTELGRRFDSLGVSLAPVELDSFADEISRSERVS